VRTENKQKAAAAGVVAQAARDCARRIDALPVAVRAVERNVSATVTIAWIAVPFGLSYQDK